MNILELNKKKRLILGQVEARLAMLEDYETKIKYGTPSRSEGAGPKRTE